MNDFFKDIRKEEKKLVESGISVKSERPKYWISVGNYLLNKIISGKYRGGIGQGRIAGVTGPSSAGKSFIVGNISREAQKQGVGLFVLDSENALDDDFMTALGVDVTRDDYFYRGVSTIPQATVQVMNFLKNYRKHNMTQPFLIVLDSIDMLRTDSQATNYDKGDVKGDQGQHAKQVKAMLADWVHDIKSLNVSIVCAKQVFQEQDPMLQKNPQTAWKFTESAKYAFSQILLVTKFMLKDETAKKIPGRSDTQYSGIRLKAYGFKTRFTKPFQSASIEVPYETGMDPFDGLLQMAVSIGVVEQNGAWYSFNGTKFQSKNFEEHQEAILDAMVEKESVYLEDTTEGEIVEALESSSDKRKRRLIQGLAEDESPDDIAEDEEVA